MLRGLHGDKSRIITRAWHGIRCIGRNTSSEVVEALPAMSDDTFTGTIFLIPFWTCHSCVIAPITNTQLSAIMIVTVRWHMTHHRSRTRHLTMTSRALHVHSTSHHSMSTITHLQVKIKNEREIIANSQDINIFPFITTCPHTPLRVKNDR